MQYGQITDKICFQKCYCQNEQIASFQSLPCAKGGAEERGGGIVKYINSIKNNPSVALRDLLANHLPFTQGSLFVLCKFIVTFYMVRFVSSLRADFSAPGKNGSLNPHAKHKCFANASEARTRRHKRLANASEARTAMHASVLTVGC